MHFYGVSEEVVLETWTVEKFRRYQQFVISQLNQNGASDGR